MKSVLIFVLIIFCGILSFAQIQYTPELAVKLAGKTNFQEIKSTVINHYREKLAILSSADSVEKKRIIRQLKMWNRRFWINENYTNARGNVEPATKVITKALAKIKQEAATATNLSQAQSENWVSEGPEISNHGVGRIDRIAFHPTNPLILYAGSPYGGLFKSILGGAYWTPVSPYVASLGVSGIAIHPTNPDIIYVLSGNSEGDNGFHCASNGVYKTINGGNTWQKLTDFPNTTEDTIYWGNQLIMDPANSAVLFAATSRGLFKTTDSGNTWTNLTSSLTATPLVNIWDVKFKPGNSSIVYITGDTFFAKSENNQPFTIINIPALATASRVSMAVTPANSNKVMLLAGKAKSPADSLIGVFTSVNSGSSFSQTYAGNNLNIFNNYIGQPVTAGQVRYNSNIEISRTNENIVYTGGLVIWKSTDAGNSWNQSTAYWPSDNNYVHPDHHCLKINPLDNKLYNGNDGGVYVSADESTSWNYISNGLSTSQFYHFEVENDEGNTWGGCQDNGIQQRVTGLQFEEYAGGDGYDVMTDNVYRVADGEGNDVYFSVNEKIKKDGIGGIYDISVPQNVCNTCPKNFFANLDMSPTLEDIIYAGYSTAVYRSINAGSDWLSMGNIPGNWCIAVCHSNDQRLYAAGFNTANPAGGIRRNDEVTSNNWNLNLNTDLYLKGYNGTLKITDIEVDNVNADSLIISVAGTKADAKVFSSANGGITWNNLSFNLPNVPVFCVKKDELGGLYVGTSLGVYYKSSNKNYWVPFYNGLPPVPVTQMEFYAANSRLQVCTFGRGIWSTAKVTNCTNDLTLTGSVAGRNYYEVSNNINSNQTILNSPGTNIIYSAGNKITFAPGTHIQKGAKFRGKAQPCGSEVKF